MTAIENECCVGLYSIEITNESRKADSETVNPSSYSRKEYATAKN